MIYRAKARKKRRNQRRNPAPPVGFPGWKVCMSCGHKHLANCTLCAQCGQWESMEVNPW